MPSENRITNAAASSGGIANWPAQRRKLMLLAIGLPIALWLARFLSAQLNWSVNVGAIPFALLFCGCSAALWVYGVWPDLLALPIAFAATLYYFVPAAFAPFSARDFLRVVVILAVLFAPIHVAGRMEGHALGWNAAYLPALDGWRAIAVLLVMLDHLLRGMAADRHAPPPDPFLLGQQGVNIFFGISGLLITWKLLEEKQQTGNISLPHFYRRRIYRIFPAAFVFLTAMGLLSVLGLVPATRLDLASAILYFRNFVPVFWPSLSNAHFWSLSLEEQFYLCLPAALLFSRIRRFAVIAAGLAMLCAAWRWYFFHYLATPDLPLSVRFRTDLRIDGLLCGCLMAIVLQDERARHWFRRMLTTPVLLALLVVFGILMHWSGERTVLAESIIIPIMLAATLLSPQKLPARILEWKPLSWIGKISYSLYLWQQFFLLCPVNHWLLRPLHRFPICILVTFACATLSYYFLELPMMRRAHSQTVPPKTREVLELGLVRT